MSKYKTPLPSSDSRFFARKTSDGFRCAVRFQIAIAVYIAVWQNTMNYCPLPTRRFRCEHPIQPIAEFTEALRFMERIRGDHHIFTKHGVEDIINLQPQGNKAKPYQVKQVRRLVVKYRLSGDGDENE